MKALRYRTIGLPPEVTDIEKPVPAFGELLLKVAAAGICHSDQVIMGLPEDQYIYGPPLTLGMRRPASWPNWVRVTEVQVADPVAVYGPWGCGPAGSRHDHTPLWQ